MTYILYHEAAPGVPCADGFAAAFAAWMKFGDQAHYIPVRYGQPFPTIRDPDYVYVLDFSWKRREMVEAFKSVDGQMIVLDHHESAEKELEGLDFARFDKSRSGAVMAWEHLHPKHEVPPLLLHVQDRDLWRYQLDGTREIDCALRFHVPWRFQAWRDLIAAWKTARPNLIKAGETAAAYRDEMVRKLVADPQLLRIGEEQVVAVNSTVWHSDIGHALLEAFPESPFAAIYSVGVDGMLSVSLRSRGDVDVSAVASERGGGGHVAAAGFRVQIENLRPLQVA